MMVREIAIVKIVTVIAAYPFLLWRARGIYKLPSLYDIRAMSQQTFLSLFVRMKIQMLAMF